MATKREQKIKRTRAIAVVAVLVFCFSTLVAIFGLGNSVSEIRQAELAQSPEAILASSGVKDGKNVLLPVTYYDQKMDGCVDLYDPAQKSTLEKRQFEWSECGYRSKRLEQGLVEDNLSSTGIPVATNKSKLTPNRGIDFARWFDESNTLNAKSTGSLELTYTAEGAKFSFAAANFYPLDKETFSAADPVNEDGHNHLFTMNFNIPFTTLANGSEQVVIRADDDTFVYLNDQLVIDMGGIHNAMIGGVAINDAGQIFTSVNGATWAATEFSLQPGEFATLRVYHADRDASDSLFELEITGMHLLLDGSTQIAAVDSTDSGSGYAEPLGESKVFRADTAQTLMIIATVEGLTVVVAAMSLAIVARMVIHRQA